MFPVAINLKPGQKLINLDKMPFFCDIKPNQQMIDILKIPMGISFVPYLYSQEPLLTNQGCL